LTNLANPEGLRLKRSKETVDQLVSKPAVVQVQGVADKRRRTGHKGLPIRWLKGTQEVLGRDEKRSQVGQDRRIPESGMIKLVTY
jgi:hypothetical protein